jgi:[phosphatase 2A protein]-leucine-carboxy methyltransferase
LFLRQHEGDVERQIISLGAGTDTRSLRLFSQADGPKVVYHELDFPAICKRKLATVRASAVLRQVFSSLTDREDGSWQGQSAGGSQLFCHGIDLRELAQKEDASFLVGLKTEVPTLLVSECCLCYLRTQEAADVIRWFTSKIPNLGIVLYEPIKPDDPFGKMMVSNLAARGITMPTLEEYREPRDQETRFQNAGFLEVRQMTIDRVWDQWISEEEKERVDGLEGLDEVEEWKLLSGHYIVAWAWKGNGFASWLV